MLPMVAGICTAIAIYMFLVWIGFLDSRQYPSWPKFFWYIFFCALAGVAWSIVLT